MNCVKLSALVAFCLTGALFASPAMATPLPVDSFTTVFGPGAPGGGGDLAEGVGEFPDSSVLGPIGAFTDFSVQSNSLGTLPNTPNEGQILFFQNGGFYVGGAAGNLLSTAGEENIGPITNNNRAYGVFGTGRSDFTFSNGVVTSILLQARGTETGQNIGPLDLGQSLPANTPLADAVASIEIYTNQGLQITTTVDNSSFETLSVALGGSIGNQTLNGDFITRVSLINQGPLNSAIVLGELTVGTQGVNPNGIIVPEPTSLVLIGMSAGLIGFRRRR